LTVMTSLALLFANTAFWSTVVILITVLAIPGFFIWVIVAYLLSYLSVLQASLVPMAKYLVPKLPRKAKRLRIH
jgi:hypothetical protein